MSFYSNLPYKAARCKAERPLSSFTFGSAPFSSRRWTNSAYRSAQYNAVIPFSEDLWLTSIPLLMSTLHTSMCFEKTAQCKAVQPWSFVIFTSALSRINNSTTFSWPETNKMFENKWNGFDWKWPSSQATFPFKIQLKIQKSPLSLAKCIAAFPYCPVAFTLVRLLKRSSLTTFRCPENKNWKLEKIDRSSHSTESRFNGECSFSHNYGLIVIKSKITFITRPLQCVPIDSWCNVSSSILSD